LNCIELVLNNKFKYFRINLITLFLCYNRLLKNKNIPFPALCFKKIIKNFTLDQIIMEKNFWELQNEFNLKRKNTINYSPSNKKQKINK